MHVVLYISIRFQSCKALFETPCIIKDLLTFLTPKVTSAVVVAFLFTNVTSLLFANIIFVIMTGMLTNVTIVYLVHYLANELYKYPYGHLCYYDSARLPVFIDRNVY